MNKFNKKGQNNVKRKARERSQRSKDRAEGREQRKLSQQEQQPADAADGGAAAPPALGLAAAGGAKAKGGKRQLERLAVSGVRTGKHKRKLARHWQKTQLAALDSGAVTMEDIVQYASYKKSSTGGGMGDEVMASTDDGASRSSSAVSAVASGGGVSSTVVKAGIRLRKPSKKARLKLKGRFGSKGGAQGASAMVE